ncbi:uncharacterized protein LOC136085089 [Hydra vulgaris]|uniref:Uncharacterized protein LOC136085089 n=1 Tax=Hydra vulgaris TaxID=6087 RepID=A0ABM4CL39_HYDVU
MSLNSVKKVDLKQKVNLKANIKNNEDVFSQTFDLEIIECFKIFDINGSGMITANDLLVAISEFGFKFSRDDIDILMEEIDAAGLGGITFNNFKDIVRRVLTERPTEIELESVFNFIDKSNDGYVSSVDLQLVFRQCGEMYTADECLKFIEECSSKKKGLFTLDEFKDYCKTVFQDGSNQTTDDKLPTDHEEELLIAERELMQKI